MAAALSLKRKRREEAPLHFAGRLQVMKHLVRDAQNPLTDQSQIHYQRERRQSERAAVLTPAIIVLSPEKKIMCQALDMSAGGARLKLPTQPILPETFEVAVPAYHLRTRARLVWRLENSIGIKFVQAAESVEEPECAPSS
jgi:hypothetical protein